MIKNLIITSPLFFLLILVQGCDRGTSGVDFIDYTELDEVSTEVLMEIGHRDQDPIFGTLNSLVVTDNHSIIVADLANRRIDQFSVDGKHSSVVATRGEGPGELSPLFDLALGVEGSLIIQHFGMENRVDHFIAEPGENGFQYDNTIIQEAVMDHRNRILGLLSRNYYLINVEKVFRLSDPIRDTSRSFIESKVAVVDRQFETVRDSVSVLRAPFPVIHETDRSFSMIGSPPFQLHDRVKVLRGGRYLIAKPDSSEITFYNEQSVMDHRLTLKVNERDVTEDEIREFLADYDREHHQRFRDRIPEIKPPFLDVWASDSHILLKTDEFGEEQEMVILQMDGEPVGKFYLSTYDDVRWMEGDRIYSLHQHPEEGHSIRVYGLIL